MSTITGIYSAVDCTPDRLACVICAKTIVAWRELVAKKTNALTTYAFVRHNLMVSALGAADAVCKPTLDRALKVFLSHRRQVARPISVTRFPFQIGLRWATSQDPSVRNCRLTGCGEFRGHNGRVFCPRVSLSPYNPRLAKTRRTELIEECGRILGARDSRKPVRTSGTKLLR